MGEASSGHVAHLAIEAVSAAQQDLEEVRARIRAEFPGWSVWRARRRDGTPGSWCATRVRLLTCDEMYRGLARTLVCDSFEQLRDELITQAECEEKFAGS